MNTDTTLLVSHNKFSLFYSTIFIFYSIDLHILYSLIRNQLVIIVEKKNKGDIKEKCEVGTTVIVSYSWQHNNISQNIRRIFTKIFICRKILVLNLTKKKIVTISNMRICKNGVLTIIAYHNLRVMK